MPSRIDELQALVFKQQKQITKLSSRITTLEKNRVPLEQLSQTEQIEADEDSDEQSNNPDVPPSVDEVESPTNLFKLFGVVGIILIMLGMIYFYKYAIDQGWIGIIERVVVGIIVSIIFLASGLVLYRKKYVHFSQVILAVGLGILYFTFFATYHFEVYRNALSMSLLLNTILLFTVMIAGMIIGIKLGGRWIVYGSLGLGFFAAFLSGITGNTVHVLIFILLIDIIILCIAKIKSWYVSIPAQILTYIAYSIWYVRAMFDGFEFIDYSASPIFIGVLFLAVYYILFTVLSFIQLSDSKKHESLVLSLINIIALAGFGVGIVNHYYSEFNGLYLVFVAVLALFIAVIAKRIQQTKMLDAYLLYTCILVTIAIPVQFDYTIVTVLWVILALGLALIGLKLGEEKIFMVGYIGYFIPLIRVITYDMFILEYVQRWIAVGSVVFGLYFMQIIIQIHSKDETIKKDLLYNLFSGIGIFYIVIWIAREVTALSIDRQMQMIILSISWAMVAILFITYGVIQKRRLFNWSGVLLFGIVVLKIVFVDLSSMDNILRVLALFIVGCLALIGSFIFVKNREKLEGLL